MSAARMLVKSSVDRFLPRSFTSLSSTPLSFNDPVVTNTVSSILSACWRYPSQFLTMPRKLPTVLIVSCTFFGDSSCDRLVDFLADPALAFDAALDGGFRGRFVVGCLRPLATGFDT